MTLQQLLDENKITQAWLAKSLSISPPAMNAMVYGRSVTLKL